MTINHFQHLQMHYEAKLHFEESVKRHPTDITDPWRYSRYQTIINNCLDALRSICTMSLPTSILQEAYIIQKNPLFYSGTSNNPQVAKYRTITIEKGLYLCRAFETLCEQRESIQIEPLLITWAAFATQCSQDRKDAACLLKQTH